MNDLFSNELPKEAALSLFTKLAAPAKPMQANPAATPRSKGPNIPPPGVVAPKPLEAPNAKVSAVPPPGYSIEKAAQIYRLAEMRKEAGYPIDLNRVMHLLKLAMMPVPGAVTAIPKLKPGVLGKVKGIFRGTPKLAPAGEIKVIPGGGHVTPMDTAARINQKLEIAATPGLTAKPAPVGPKPMPQVGGPPPIPKEALQGGPIKDFAPSGTVSAPAAPSVGLGSRVQGVVKKHPLLASAGLGAGAAMAFSGSGKPAQQQPKYSSLNKEAFDQSTLIPKALGLGATAAGAFWGARNGKSMAAQTANEASPEYSRRNAEQTAGRLGLMGGGVIGAGVAHGIGKAEKRILPMLGRYGADAAQSKGLYAAGATLAGAAASGAAGHLIGKSVAKHKAEKLKDRQFEQQYQQPGQVKTAGLFMKPSDISLDNSKLGSLLEQRINETDQTKSFNKKASFSATMASLASNDRVIGALAGAGVGATASIIKTQFTSPKVIPIPEDPEDSFIGKTMAATGQFSTAMDSAFRDHPVQSALASAALGAVAGFNSPQAITASRGLVNRLRGVTGV